MRKFYVSIIVLMVTIAVSAQTREYVDLGLPSGTLWATCNVGAEAPEEMGVTFAWGETEPKEHYTWDNYKWYKNNTNPKRYAKYVPYKDVTGYWDNKFRLDPEDDAATANWGSEWRTPNYNEVYELIQNTTAKFTTVNGRNGLVLTSKKNRKYIFLPASNIDIALYWTASICDVVGERLEYNEAYVMLFSDTTPIKTSVKDRYRGFCIRPVRAKVTTSIDGVIDDQKATKSGKYIVGGKLVIVKDGKKYNANGIEIK